MASDDQLPSTGELAAKAANNLINKLAKGGWLAYEPTHVKRMAKAQAKALTILAKAETEVTDIQRRAAQRWLREEERHQENIEAVVKGALPDLSEKAAPETLDDEWLSGFFDYAKKVSDAEMRTLWSRVLAGEANTPGSFKKRVLQAVSLLEREDADLFVSLCRFGLRIVRFTPVVFDSDHQVYRQFKINFNTLTHLDAVGLVSFNNVSGFVRKGLPDQFTISYGHQAYKVGLPENKTLPIGTVRLTDVGSQLATLCNPEVVPEFEQYFLEEWQAKGCNIVRV